LDGILRQVIVAEGQVEVWANVISALRRCILPYLGDSRLLAQAEDLWLQAQVMVGETAQQAQRHQAAQLEEQTKILNEIRAALITTFDMNALMDTLARELPRLGIPACYLSLYEDPKRPIELSRLTLAYDLQRGRLDLEAEKQSFPSPNLVPQGMLPQDRRYNLVTEALYFREEQLGFVLFETGSRKGPISGMLQKGPIYGMLREEISSALQGARLVQRVQAHSAETTRQQYVLDMFMRNVPDRIYFKDTQSRITQTNRAFAIRIGKDPKELIGKSDFDLYPLEQAEIKYQQEQDIIKTGQPILELEEPDGVDRWALTTKMPLRDENGAIIGTFGISSDITELVKARQAAEVALKEADKARSIAEKEKAKAEVAKNEAQKAHHEAEIANQTLAAQIWQTTGQALLNEKMRGEQDISTLANNVIQQLCKYLGVDSGAIYVLEEKVLQLIGTYAYRRKSLVQQYQVGEGQVGQAVIEKETIFKEIPDDYIALSLRQGKVLPKYSLVAPVVYNQQASGVVMLESMTEFSLPQRNFLEKAIESVAIAFMTAQARARVNELFSQTRQQAEELQAQEEELRATNEELEAQTESLRASENRLKTNQAALEAANADLEEKTHILQEQQTALDYQNRTLREAQQELERKAEELTVTNKYKSEFLANMSHELRTPLNSLLILSRMLANNDEGNLTPNQAESAEIIYTSGAELLELINDILDLSKVEAGHMTFSFESMLLTSLAQSMRSQFEHVAQQKNLRFETSLTAGLPESITTDHQRVEQVIKNLLSNAFKFTETGALA
jgi:PAS domain S-box-containing protein